MPQGRFFTNYDHETWQDSVDAGLAAPVDTAKLVDNAVTTAKIANLAVTTAKLADANVTTAKIADAAATLAKLDRTGTLGRVLTAQGSGNAPVWGGSIVVGTAVNSTSGTAIDFTGIPAGVNRVTLSFANVSTNGTSEVTIQLGTSSGVEATGYIAGTGFLASNPVSVAFTDGFTLGGVLATDQRNGVFQFTRLTGNQWACWGLQGFSSGPVIVTAGTKSLAALLDRVRITTRGGVNTFDLGTINISWEF